MNNNPLDSIVRSARKKRILKRTLSMLCAVVLVFTMHTLRRDANTLERIPMCGYTEEHVHTSDCYDGDALVCGKYEHLHTDACYQESPENGLEIADTDIRGDTVVDPALTEQGLELSLSDTDFALDMEDVTPGLASNDAQEQPLSFTLGQEAMLSGIISALSLEIDFADIVDVGIVDDEQTENDLIGIEKTDGDYRIWARKDFERMQLALIRANDILVITLLDGVAAPAVDIGPTGEDASAVEAAPVVDDTPAQDDVSEADDAPALEDVPAADDVAVSDVETVEDVTPVAEERTEVGTEAWDEQPAEEEQTEVETENGEETDPAEDEQGEEEAAFAGVEQAEAEDLTIEEEIDEQPAEEGEEAAGQTEGAQPEETAEQTEEQPAEEGEEAAGQNEEAQPEETAEQPEEQPAEEGEETAEQPEDAQPEETAEQPEEQPAEEGEETAEQAEGAQPEEQPAEESEEATEEGEEEVDEEQPKEEQPAEEGEETAEQAEEAQSEEQGEEAAEQTGEEQTDAQSAEDEEETVEIGEELGDGEVEGQEEAEDAGDGEHVEDESATEPSVITATVDLSGVAEYPMSLNTLLAEAAPAVEEPIEDAPAENAGESAEDVAEEPAEIASDDEPAEEAAWHIEYDEALLSIEEAEGDYWITPVQRFEATVIDVDNGSRYALTLVNCALPEAEEAAEAPAIAYPAQDFEGRTEYVTVTVSAPEGAFPEGTTMAVADVEDEKTLTDIEDTVSEEFVEVKRVHAVDITFTDAEGNEIEPLLPISVVMRVEEKEQQQEAVVVHVDDAGETEVVESQSEAPAGETEVKVEMPATDAPAEEAAEGEAQEGEATEAEKSSVGFEADTFSVYAVVITETIETKYIDAEGATWNISVGYGPEAGIPAGARLAVEEVEGDYLEQTAELLKGRETITLARFFDITILDAEGNAVQPARPVEVKATLAEQSEDAVKAVHFAEEGPEIIEASQDEEAISFDADSFSVYGIVYTVDFHYGEAGKVYEISLPGGGAIGLRELAVALGLVEVETTEEAGEDIALGNSDAALDFIEDVESVVFSNEELIRIVPVDVNVTVGALKEMWGLEPEYSAELTEAQLAELNGKVLYAPDWALVSMKPFDTDETLTVTMKNGDVITVAVTDAQLQKSVISASGETYVITVTYDDDAEIPEDAGLRVTEILPGDEGYEDYLNRAMQALSGERTEIEAVEPTNDEPAEAEEAPEAGQDEAEQAEAGDAQADYARFFDIQIWAGDRQIEPKAAVSVRIELADAPEERQDALAVVHFEADGPVVMDAEVVNAADIRFETESFSTYGVIRTGSSSQFTSSNVDDLIGKPFTLNKNGQYFKAETDTGNSPYLLKKASGEADAGVWFIKRANSSDVKYILYTYSASGEELQLQFTKNSGKSANVNLVGGGNWFDISKNGDNTYTFRGWLNGTDNYYLNYWNGGAGLAGYADTDNNDHLTVKTLPEPAQDNQNYFVILKQKQGDEYFAVLNDGRLEQVTVGSDGKFAINVEPMMWKYLKENNDHYLRHESYARTVTDDRRAKTWYYSYINPNAEGGFSDPWVCPPLHDDLRKEWKEEYRAEHPGCSEAEVDQYAQAKEAEYKTKFDKYDEDNEDIKANSKIALVNIGGKYYIKSATTGSFIGVDGGAMKGNVDSANAAEVFFADAGNITTWTGYNQFERMARHHVVEHIDIGVNGKAELHVPLPADTYFDKDGNPIVVPSHTVLRVKADVPIDSQDIKNAKLTAFQDGPNGEKIVVNDAYYITGYSGNAPTSISAAQVRYEGQFKVAWEDGRDPAHENGGADKDNTIPDIIDPYEGDVDWRKWRLEHQVYYNVNLTKQVTFELEYNGTKLYNAAGKQLVSKVPVELSGSFSYWDPNNECPAIHDDFNTDNGYWHAGHYGDPTPGGWDSIGWRDESDANKKINGIIPHAAWGNSGMDFILGGSKDQTAVVITKFIEDESGNVIHLQSETVSKVKVLQKDIDASNPKSETDKVKEKYTVRNTATNEPALGDIYGRPNQYRVYGEAQRNIVVGVEGYGTIYDFDVRRGMVGVEEIRAQEGGFPEVVTDADGNQWEYVHTYIRTDYVTRKNGDTQDKYHYTKNYTKADTNYLSVPEVLGPYKRDDEYYDEDLKQNTYDDNSDFLEFYIHNVYKPRKIQVEVEKEWKQGSRTIDPPSDARVQVPLKRYKLVPKEEFHQATDKYLKAQVNVYRENYIPKKTLYRNGSDFHAGDTLTVTLEYTFNAESVRYRVNGQDYVVCPTFPDGPEPEAAVNNNHRLRYAFDVTVPEDGELTVDVDDNWTCASVASVTVKACNHGNGSQGTGSGSATESENVDGVPVPPSPADKPNMVYTVDTSWAGETISLPGEAWNGSVWKGKSGDLDAYDEKGNAYLYFIDEAGVTEENVPAGTMKFVGRASNGSYLTSTGFYYDPSTQQIVATEDNETLKVVNQVPATVKLLKKDAQTQQDLVGARFALYRLETTGWAMIEDIDMSSNSSATIPELYDGRYKLEEVESPTEHKVLDNAMYFRVRNGEASLTNENGSAYTPVADNLIELNGSALTVRNTPVGKLEISKTVTSVSNATGQDFTFTVTLKNIDDSAYTGTATLTDKTHNAERVTVGNGTLTVIITGTGTATIDNLPVGTKFEVVETEANGWSQVSSEWRHNGVVQEDTTPKVIAKGVTDAVTFTNTQLGTLQITKLVRLDGQQPSGDDIGIADGTYTFTVAGPSPATAVLKYVQIKVENGVATSHRIADTEEALVSTNWITSAIAVLENLAVGDYVITETDRGQLALTDIAGGKQIQEEGQAPHNDADLTAGTVTVTVASGTIAQADVTYTNSMFKATINILKIDETTRQNDTPTRLSKAKFTLKKWNGTSTYEPMETKTTEDATGTLSFTGLSNGEYKIEEDETPPGFVMVENNDIYFSVENGVVKRFDKGVDQTDRKEIPSQVITNPGNESESETKDVVIAKISYSTDASTHSAQFIVGNTPGARLPSTGGHGTTLYHVLGTLLMLGAAILLVVKRRMQA